MQPVRSHLTRSLAAGAIILGSIAALGVSPASAAPGDAAASGITANVGVKLLATPLVTVNGGLGLTSAPPSEQNTTVAGVIGVPAVAGLTVGVIDSESNSDPSGVNAAAEVTGATLSVPAIAKVIGGPILSTGTSVISSSADCGPGVDPSTGFIHTSDLDLRIAGQPVTLDVNGEAVVTINALGVPVGTVSLRTDVSTTFTNTAEAVAIIATVDINVLTVGRVTGEVRIAEASCEKADEVPADAPTIIGITPNEGPVAGGQTVTITGTDFVAGDTTVNIDGTVIPAADVNVIDGETLTYVTPPHAVGPVDVSVTTPAGESDTLSYTYVDDGTPVDAPVVTNIAPDQGPIAGGTEVVLTGTGFVDGDTTITIGGTLIPVGDVTVNADGTTATFTTPAHAEGPVDVTATTGNGTSAPQTFTYTDDNSDNVPTATVITPDAGPIEGGTTVIIEGTNFVPGETTVTIGGTVIDASDVTVGGDGTTITFIVPPHAEGPVDVTVTTPDGTTDPLTYTYIDDTPTDPEPTDPTTPVDPDTPTSNEDGNGNGNGNGNPDGNENENGNGNNNGPGNNGNNNGPGNNGNTGYNGSNGSNRNSNGRNNSDDSRRINSGEGTSTQNLGMILAGLTTLAAGAFGVRRLHATK